MRMRHSGEARRHDESALTGQVNAAGAQQLLRQLNSALVRHANLEAVLARVARARHEARDARKVNHREGAEEELAEVQLGQTL